MERIKADLAFPAACRIRQSKEFNRVWQAGKRYHTPHFIVITWPNGLGRSRLGVTVSRKVGNAVCRNRLKRWLREYFRQHLKFLAQSLDFSIIAKRQAGQLDHPGMIEELRALSARLETGRYV